MNFWNRIANFFKRTTPENPSFDINSPEAWDAFDAGSNTTAGIAVNRTTALAFAPFFRGVNLIARDVGKIPLHTYVRVGSGKSRAVDHPIYQLLRYKPNDYQTANVFRSQLTGHALTTGNGYAYVERENMRPVSLLPMIPETVTPLRANGILKYWWRDKGESRLLDSWEVFHVKGLGFDGMCGYSVVQIGKEALGLGLGAQKFQTIMLKNGARPGVVLECPGSVTVQQRTFLRETWDKMHSGIENAHRTAILEGGMKANSLTFSAEDQQLIESRKFQLTDIANLLGIPVHKIGGEGRTAYASLEQENQSYLDDALDYWLHVWEAEAWDKLLTEKEKAADTHVIEFMRSALVRADLAAQANYARAALGGHPWETINDVRGRMNLNPIEDGDRIPEPLNMANPGGINNRPEDPAADNVKSKGPNKNAARIAGNIVADAERRVIRRIAVHAEKAAKQPKEFLAWLDRMNAEHKDAVRSILEPAYENFHAVYESEPNPNHAGEFLDGIRSELLELSGQCRPAELLARVTAWAQEREKKNGTPAE